MRYKYIEYCEGNYLFVFFCFRFLHSCTAACANRGFGVRCFGCGSNHLNEPLAIHSLDSLHCELMAGEDRLFSPICYWFIVTLWFVLRRVINRVINHCPCNSHILHYFVCLLKRTLLLTAADVEKCPKNTMAKFSKLFHLSFIFRGI